MTRQYCSALVLLLTIIFLAGSAIAPVARASEHERIIVMNVRLAGRDAPVQDVSVNLLIVGGKLSVVTKDDLVIQHGDVAVDASSSFILGQLVLGTRASFVILDRDPRDDFDVLLDTQAHVRFAIQEGVIVKNELPAKLPSHPEAMPRPRRWKAYTPPPVAVPIRYYDSRKWNKIETKPISGLFTGAVLLDRQFWLSQDGESRDQVGKLKEYEGGEIRALRFGLVGTLNFNRRWGYTVFAATNTFDKGFDVDTTDEFAFLDYRLDIPMPHDLTLSVGKQKEPISMERVSSLASLPMQERSAVADALLPARNFGLVLSGTGGEWSTWAVGAFNNWIDSGQSFRNTSSQFVGRLTWVPARSQDESNLMHLGVGLRHSNTKQPIRGRTEPEFNKAPVYVDTGPLSADGLMTYNLETYWRTGPYLVGFEYLGTDIDSADSGDPFFRGYHFTGSWIVTGEMRGYRKRSGIFDPVPVARPVNEGGWGAFETVARFSRLDLTEGTVEGGDMEVFSLGLNWWLTRRGQFSFNYRFISLDRLGYQGKSSGLNVRLLLMLD